MTQPAVQLDLPLSVGVEHFRSVSSKRVAGRRSECHAPGLVGGERYRQLFKASHPKRIRLMNQL